MRRPRLRLPSIPKLSPDARVSALWTAGLASFSAGEAVAHGLGRGLDVAGIGLVVTAVLYARGADE